MLVVNNSKKGWANKDYRLSNPTPHNEKDLVQLGMEVKEDWEDEKDLDIWIEKENSIEGPESGHAGKAKLGQVGKATAGSKGPSRRQYPREYKLRAIRYAQKYSVSKYKVAQKFRITTTMLRKWIRNADSILDQRIGQRRNTKGLQALFPAMEIALYQEFLTMRNTGCKVKVNWFLIKARKLFEQYYPKQIYINEEGKKA